MEFNFKPLNEDERIWTEQYNAISQYISSKIRALKTKEERLFALKAADPGDFQLMNLYMIAYKSEDYETCEVAKILLEERGIKVPS
jgi:hypothetical protein